MGLVDYALFVWKFSLLYSFALRGMAYFLGGGTVFDVWVGTAFVVDTLGVVAAFGVTGFGAVETDFIAFWPVAEVVAVCTVAVAAVGILRMFVTPCALGAALPILIGLASCVVLGFRLIAGRASSIVLARIPLWI